MFLTTPSSTWPSDSAPIRRVRSAARHDDVAAAAVHLEDGELLGLAHQRADVAHRADIDLAAGQEGHGAAEIDGEAAFDAAEDRAHDPLLVIERLLEHGPGFLAASL